MYENLDRNPSDDDAKRMNNLYRVRITVAPVGGGSYFGYPIHNLRGKPTNSEFIAMIADKMRLDKRQQAG